MTAIQSAIGPDSLFTSHLLHSSGRQSPQSVFSGRISRNSEDTVNLSEAAQAFSTSTRSAATAQSPEELVEAAVSVFLSRSSFEYSRLNVSLQEPAEAEQAVSTNAGYLRAEGSNLDFAASGSVSTADGTAISFNLGLNVSKLFLQDMSLQFNGNNDGGNAEISYSGVSAEIASMSFSFSFSATGVDGTELAGNGRFDTGDAMKIMKPLVKVAAKAEGYPQGWSLINRLIRGADEV